jgi:hypothetical protein
MGTALARKLTFELDGTLRGKFNDDDRTACTLVPVDCSAVSPAKEFTVAECVPTKIYSLFDRVVFEEQPKRCRRTVVKEDEQFDADVIPCLESP